MAAFALPDFVGDGFAKDDMSSRMFVVGESHEPIDTSHVWLRRGMVSQPGQFLYLQACSRQLILPMLMRAPEAHHAVCESAVSD